MSVCAEIGRYARTGLEEGRHVFKIFFLIFFLTESHLCSERSSSDVRLNVEKQEEDSLFPGTAEDLDCVKQAVFLSTSICKFSPYQIHCRRIFPGIILVVLTEVYILIIFY